MRARHLVAASFVALVVASVAIAEGAAAVQSQVGAAEPIAIFLSGEMEPPAIHSLVIKAPEATITRYQEDYSAIASIWIKEGQVESRRHVHNLTMSLVRAPGFGYLALDGLPGVSVFSYVPESGAPPRFAWSNMTIFSYGNSTPGAYSPDTHYYYRKIDDPHLVSQDSGRLSFTGGGVVKILGLSFKVESDEWSEEIFTGARRTSDDTSLPGLQTQRVWIVVEAEEMTVELASTSPWSSAAAWVDVREGGICRRVAPAPKPRAFVGVVEQCEMHDAASMGAPANAGLDMRILGAAMMAAGGAGAAVAAWWRRGRRGPQDRLSAELCMQLAESQVLAENWPRALHWAEKARHLAPTSALVRATQGFVLAQLERWDEALAAYEEASALAPHDGEHDLDAARTAAAAGRPPELVATFLLRALAQSPSLVSEVDGDEDLLGPLAGDAEVARALVDAWSHVGGRAEDEGP